MSEGKSTVAYLRSFIFGVEDSLVSTVGLLSGIAIAGMSREDIFVTGVILIFVEAISMMAGSFLSESSAEEYETKHDTPTKRSYFSALIMFFSYFVSGFIPLFPYMVLPTHTALWASIALSAIALTMLGWLGGMFSRTSAWKSALRMLIVGGLAIGVGVTVGHFLG